MESTTYWPKLASRQMGAAAYIFKRDCTPRQVMETIAGIIKRHKEKKMGKK